MNEDLESKIRETLINRGVEGFIRRASDPDFSPQGLCVGDNFYVFVKVEDGKNEFVVTPKKELKRKERKTIEGYGEQEVRQAIYAIEKVWYMTPEDYEQLIRKEYSHMAKSSDGEQWFSGVFEDHRERYEKNQETIRKISVRAGEVGLEKALEEYYKEQRFLSQFIVL